MIPPLTLEEQSQVHAHLLGLLGQISIHETKHREWAARDAALAAWNANLLRLNKGKIIKPPSVVQCTGSAGWEFGQAEFTLAICLPQHSFTIDGLTRKDMEELSSCVLTLLSSTDAELSSNLLRNKQQPPSRAKGKS